MDIGAAPYLIAALLPGAAAGLAFAFAWRRAFPAGAQSRFWIHLSALSQEILVVDTVPEFLGVYRRLGVTLGGYLARNLAVTAVGGAALVAALFLGLGPLAKAWDSKTGVVTATPAQVNESARRSGDTIAYRIGDASVTAPADPAAARLAACWTEPSCTILSLLGFSVVTPAEEAPAFGPVVVRARHGDMNPLWPYLSDLEAAFFLAFVVSMTAAMLWPRKRQEGAVAEAAILKQSDFALVQLNEQLKPIVRLAGTLETRLAQASLPEAVTAPIFITGLARSGTTTILNALTRSPELGSHQYRDFPFLGAPLIWTKVQGVVAKDAGPVERPHKDRILISRSSPEAYEEPLWQQFFHHLHDPARSHRLTAETSNPKFEAFFVDHIRKILHLRGAPRYVSKGNYNVGRIEYLAKLFPDAHFVVPVREPVAHVASLVRQHALFCRYANDDPRTPHYLAAAGHYEFGRQRRPIRLSGGFGASPEAGFELGDAIGYARQWKEVYGHVAELKASPLGERITVVRYEDLCAEPASALADIMGRCGLADPSGAIEAFARDISISEAPIPRDVEAQRADILAVVGETARTFGYEAEVAQALAG